MSQFFQGTTAGSLPPSVPLQFTTDAGIAIPAANNLNVFGGVGTETTASGSTITVSVNTDSFNWSEQNTNFNASTQNGYYCNTNLIASLPSTASLSIGDTIIFYIDTSSTVIIQANAGQSIQVGNSISSMGGTVSSNTQGSLLELNFKVSDSTWHTIASMGSWTTT